MNERDKWASQDASLGGCAANVPPEKRFNVLGGCASKVLGVTKRFKVLGGCAPNVLRLSISTCWVASPPRCWASQNASRCWAAAPPTCYT
jgi:hypothetical protein